MWLVGIRQPPMPPISQVPRPPRIQMIAVAHTKRESPASAIRKPSTSHQRRSGVGEQVAPPAVQQRREDDAP